MITREHIVDVVSKETYNFLKRRIDKVKEHISGILNVNPFMLSALQRIHSFDNIESMSEYLFVSHLASGHSTVFGKMVDEKILPKVFSTEKLSKKIKN